MTNGKVCPRCKEYRAWADFNKHRNRYDGHAVWCRACYKEYSREYNQRPHVKKRAAEKALARYHRFTTDEKFRIQERRRALGMHLIKKYGLTVERYEQMLADQGGGCAMCRRPPKVNRRLAVDHDHACCSGEFTCGKCVRGLLCTPCNSFLGYFENAEWVARAKTYLQLELKRRKAEGE